MVYNKGVLALPRLTMSRFSQQKLLLSAEASLESVLRFASLSCHLSSTLPNDMMGRMRRVLANANGFRFVILAERYMVMKYLEATWRIVRLWDRIIITGYSNRMAKSYGNCLAELGTYSAEMFLLLHSGESTRPSHIRVEMIRIPCISIRGVFVSLVAVGSLFQSFGAKNS